jgi:hypothetical protein
MQLLPGLPGKNKSTGSNKALVTRVKPRVGKVLFHKESTTTISYHKESTTISTTASIVGLQRMKRTVQSVMHKVTFRNATK